MRLQNSGATIFILVGVLFLSVSSAFAEKAEEYVILGNASSQQGNYEQAVSEFSKAIEANPNFAEAYYNRANAYARQGDFTRAVSDYTRAIEIKPGYSEAYNNRAAAYYRQGEFDKSWMDVHKAEELGHAVNQKLHEALKQATGREN